MMVPMEMVNGHSFLSLRKATIATPYGKYAIVYNEVARSFHRACSASDTIGGTSEC